MNGLVSSRWLVSTALAAVALALPFAGSASAQADINLEPVGGIAFGDVVVGSSAEHAAAVVNDGTSPATVTGVSVSVGNGFGIKDDDCMGLTLATDEFCVVTLEFKPMLAGAQAGQLSVSSDAPGSPDVLPVSGTGVVVPQPPFFELSPSRLDLVVPHNQVPRSVTGVINITNRLSTPASLSLSIDGAEARAFRAVVADCPPTEVPAGTTCPIAVTFSQRVLGRHEARLVVQIGGAELSAPLSGTVAAAPPRPPRPPRTPRTQPPATPKPTAKSLEPALVSSLTQAIDRWQPLTRRKLRRQQGFRIWAPASTMNATLTLDVRVARGSRRLVARGQLPYPNGAVRKLSARLTKYGRALLSRPGRPRLEARLTFKGAGVGRVSTVKPFRIRS